MTDRTHSNPWLGLESYQEGQTLYGRDDDIRDLTLDILHDTGLLLHGRSGIGKSSLLNAGVLPAARREGYVPVVLRLVHNGNTTYFAQIVSAVKAQVSVREVVERQNPGHDETLYEWFHRHTFHRRNAAVSAPEATADTDASRVRLLLIFDQFEEIFTLQDNTALKKDFFAQVADQLNGCLPDYLQLSATAATPTADLPQQQLGAEQLFAAMGLGDIARQASYVDDNDIHLVFTIREDFLSEFEYFSATIPSLKHNRYALRPISEEQAADIIMRPVPGLVGRDVARLIIEKITGRTDFQLDGLPELEVDSAVLSLYLKRLYDAKAPGAPITARLVEAKGGEIILDFYTEAMAAVTPGAAEWLEDRLLNGQGRRENISQYDVLASGRVTAGELDLLTESRKVLRRFNYGGDMRVEFVHDILCPIVRTRRDERQQLRREQEQRRQMEADRQRLLQQQRRTRRRYRHALFWTLVLVVAAAAWWLTNNYLYVRQYSECYRAFTRQNGWPVGVGEPLSDSEAARLATCYRLSRSGASDRRPFSEVSVVSATTAARPDFWVPVANTADEEGSDTQAAAFATLNRRVRTIRFSAENDADGAPASRELYYDAAGTPLYGINYYLSADSVRAGQLTSKWAVFVDADGLPLRVRDNDTDRMKVFADSTGRDVRCLFYDAQGTPLSTGLDNGAECFGYGMAYDADNRIDTLYILDAFASTGNFEVRQYGAGTVARTFHRPTATATPTPVERHTETYDGRGLLTQVVIDSLSPRGSVRVGERRQHYDQLCRPDSVAVLRGTRLTQWKVSTYQGHDGQPSATACWTAAADGRPKLVWQRVSRTAGSVTDIIDDHRPTGRYRHERITRQGQSVVTEYLTRDGALTVDTLADFARKVEVTARQRDGWVTTTHYYDASGSLFSGDSEPTITISHYDRDSLLRRQLSYNADSVLVRSMGFDYRDGMEVCRYALSLDGHTPIRCPRWESDGLCYYRLYNVRNSRKLFNIAYVMAESEYPGCTSAVYFEAGPEAYEFQPEQRTIGEGWTLQQQTTIRFPRTDRTHTVTYLHITDLAGAAYRAGLRDGDLVERQSGGTVEVVRYAGGRWSRHRAVLPATGAGMETYPVAYTPSEYRFYQKGRAGV